MMMYGIEKKEYEKIEKIVKNVGGNREKEIFSRCDMIKISMETKEHKVYDIFAAKEADGHRDGFSIDVVTRKICG